MAIATSAPPANIGKYRIERELAVDANAPALAALKP